MARRSKYKKKIGCLLLMAVTVGLAAVAGYNSSLFDAPLVVPQNELQPKAFDAKVEEIVSPHYKIKAYLLEDRHNPIISVDFLFRNAGSAGDDKGEEGIAKLATYTLSDGAGKLGSQAFKEELESRAINLSFYADKDDFKGSLLTTKENSAKAFELLRSVLQAPRFDAEDLERAKQRLTEAIKRQSEQPESALALNFARELYGEHPYGRNPYGKAEDIVNVTREKMQNFVRDRFSRQNLIVGIAGDISADEAGVFLDEVFGVLPEKGRVDLVSPAETDFNGQELKIDRDSGQNFVMMAWPGVARNDEEFYSLFIASHIIGGSGLTSRLSQKIREEKGLTYGVYTYLSLDDKSPLLLASFSSTPENYAEARRIFTKEWQQFQKNGVSQQELDKAKNYLIASYNLRFASISNISEILMAMQKYNLGLDFLQKRNDYIKQTDLQQVNRAAAKYFDEKKQRSAVIGKF